MHVLMVHLGFQFVAAIVQKKFLQLIIDVLKYVPPYLNTTGGYRYWLKEDIWLIKGRTRFTQGLWICVFNKYF